MKSKEFTAFKKLLMSDVQLSTENNNNRCEKCVYYDEDRNDHPCCSCHGQNFEEAEKPLSERSKG